MEQTSDAPKLRFSDDPMFKMVMEREDICRDVLARILDKPIGEITYHDTEHEHQVAPGLKNVRMDTYIVESNGRLYDVEMQMRNNPKLPLRFRGYQAVLDASWLKRGEHYSKLRESYIVFICMNDPFASGLPVYTLDRVCAEKPDLGFECGAHWMVLNASAYRLLGEESALGALLKYVYTNKVNGGDELIERIDAEVDRNNGNEKVITVLVDSLSVAREQAMIEGEEEGLKRGMEKGMKQGLEKGLKKGLEQGLEQGQDRYAKLADSLIKNDRLDDLKLANSDPEARERFFKEFGI